MTPYRFRYTVTEVAGGAPPGAPAPRHTRRGSEPRRASALVSWPGAARDGGVDAKSDEFFIRCMLGTFVRPDPGHPPQAKVSLARPIACAQAKKVGGWPGISAEPGLGLMWELRVEFEDGGGGGPEPGAVRGPGPGAIRGPGPEPEREQYR
jgi:hypothetical protein